MLFSLTSRQHMMVVELYVCVRVRACACVCVRVLRKREGGGRTDTFISTIRK